MIGRTVEVAIETIGANGDGVGHVDGMPVYVDQGLPGDALTVRLCAGRGQGYAAETVEARTLMPRRKPICGHFGMCGGCRLQHLSTPDYRRWKEQRIEAALASRGIDKVEIKPLIDGSPASRRRLRLAFRSKGKGIVLGFRKRLGQEVVAIEECPIACEKIVNIFKPLQHHLGSLDMAARGGEVTITSADNGLDLLIETPISPNLADREALAGLANTEDLARLSWRENPRAPIEPISVRRQPTVDVGGVPIAQPAGAFLQATAEAETAIRDAVAQAIDDARNIADLYAGCGALCLPFAKEGRGILAVERDPAMVQALGSAAGAAGFAGKVDAVARDLDREPLGGDELERFDALIIDPPRAGARGQALAIAAMSGPKYVAMVSCNPATFARDARILNDAGYRLSWVQPIDAFLFAAEIELVGAFERVITP